MMRFFSSFSDSKVVKPIFAYWNLRGIAEPIRYLLRYKKVDFIDKRYETDMPGYQEWQKDKFNLGLDFPNVPYYIEGDFKLTQSTAIIRYLGYKHGLIGSTNEQQRRMFLAEQQSVDLIAKMRYFVQGNEYETTTKEKFLRSVLPIFQQWEKFLGDRKFMVGDHIAYVDFIVYEFMDIYRIYHETILDDHPTLKAYFSRVKNLPELQEYFNSPDFRPWPLANPTAKFGGSGDPPLHL